MPRKLPRAVVIAAAVLSGTTALGQAIEGDDAERSDSPAETAAPSRANEDNDGFDLGLIGLASLAGLAGLMRRDHNHNDRVEHLGNRATV
jgi:hypothetical protein